MSDRMGEIRGRLAAATPGPERSLAEWLKKGWRWWKAPSTGCWPERCRVENWSGHCIAYVQDAGLAEFLAKAPADLAWLIGEVEREKARADAAEAALATADAAGFARAREAAAGVADKEEAARDAHSAEAMRLGAPLSASNASFGAAVARQIAFAVRALLPRVPS